MSGYRSLALVLVVVVASHGAYVPYEDYSGSNPYNRQLFGGLFNNLFNNIANIGVRTLVTTTATTFTVTVTNTCTKQPINKNACVEVNKPDVATYQATADDKKWPFTKGLDAAAARSLQEEMEMADK